ncbi:transcriptional repressor [Flavonifractor plautii]|nr:transcriptional repressor [Flavonifractor plautii]KAB5098546.1 transcriptional repressor [Bacteroides thetaiotaomicron]MBS6800731.1 transcriptional repressor [Clostridiales bacterium]MSB02037.1 transcriptional repressor [Flavonifractor plautii]MSB06343.1 transcriptional repressor [Flavonifractor plautii]
MCREKRWLMNGKRYSRQRELIYEALRQTEQHPTAEMIYQWLKPANPSLSLGTVYRNLNLLADEGAIRRMAFPVERYDAKTMPHPHFCCDQCGAVYDLHLPYDAELDRQALLASGHDVTGHEVVFHGICTKCKQLH